MLSGYQCEIVAYLGDSEFLCRDCAIEHTSALTVEKADMGLANSGGLTPLIRYTIDEHNGQRVWEAASERVQRFANEHPVIWAGLGDQDRDWRLIDRVAEKLGDSFDERCGQCEKVLG